MELFNIGLIWLRTATDGGNLWTR